jgi:hypothetical protein
MGEGEVDISNRRGHRITRAFALRRGARLGLRHSRSRQGFEILKGGGEKEPLAGVANAGYVM